MKTQTVIINENEYKLKLGFGVMMQYEEEYNKPITSIRKTKEIINLLYITLTYNNDHFSYSFKEFVDDIVDNQPDLLSYLIKLLVPENDDQVEDSKKK